MYATCLASQHATKAAFPVSNLDAGERLVEELAPELVPMLTTLEMPANFVPATNAVLSEMARRGVSRDRILATLRAMGGELPLGTLRMLQWAQRKGVDVRVLSDCNTLFIGHILTGAATLKPVHPQQRSAHGVSCGRCSLACCTWLDTSMQHGDRSQRLSVLLHASLLRTA